MRAMCLHSVQDDLPDFPWESDCVREMYRNHLNMSPKAYSELLVEGQRLWREEFAITFDDAMENVYSAALAAVTRGIRTIIFVPTAYVGTVYPGTPFRVLSLEQLVELARMGVIIGSHGHQHLNWTEREDSELLRDVIESVEYIREKVFQPAGICGNLVVEIAPPFGAFELRHHYLAHIVGGGSGLWGTLLSCGEWGPGVHYRFSCNNTHYVNRNGVEEPWPWNNKRGNR